MSAGLAYQEERRDELIGGKVVAMFPRPSWNHNRVSSNIYFLFANYLYRKKCIPIGKGLDLFLDEENRFIPDFMVVCDPDKIRQDGIHGAPDLVVEVLSPSTAKNDRAHKKDVYARCGVREYWLVEPDSKSIEVYRADDSDLIFHNVYVVYPDWQLAQMSEGERANMETHFQCSLFDDLNIPLEDIFYRTFNLSGEKNW